MITNTSSKRDEFLHQTRLAREERAAEKCKVAASTCIQKWIRGWLVRTKTRKEILHEVDDFFANSSDSPPSPLHPATDAYSVIWRFLVVFRENELKHKERVLTIARYIILSSQSESHKQNYISLSLSRDHAVGWITQIRKLMRICLLSMFDKLKLDGHHCGQTEKQSMTIILSLFVSLTNSSGWAVGKRKQLASGCDNTSLSEDDNKKLADLHAVLRQLSVSILNYLIQIGLYSSLQKLLITLLAKETILVKKAILSAAVTLAFRPFVISHCNYAQIDAPGGTANNYFYLFILDILTVPGLLLHVGNISPEILVMFEQHLLLEQLLDKLSNEQTTRILFNSIQSGSSSLCLIANLISLIHSRVVPQAVNTGPGGSGSKSVDVELTCLVLTRLFSCLQGRVVKNKKQNLTQWHPILGWFSQTFDPLMNQATSHLQQQLRLLWSPSLLKVMFHDLFELCLSSEVTATPTGLAVDGRRCSPPDFIIRDEGKGSKSKFSSIFKNAFERRSMSKSVSSASIRKLGSPEFTSVSLVCSLYHTALSTLTQMKLEVLTALCYLPGFLPSIYGLLYSLGPPACGLNCYLDHLAANPKATAPEFQLLILFADCMSHFIALLDDVEMYEKQEYFSLSDLANLSLFLNLFVYRSLWNGLIDLRNLSTNQLYQSLHCLLQILYRRDSQRSFTPVGHWLIKEIKVSSFLVDLEKGKKAAQVLLVQVPHILPLSERIMLFKKYISNEKAVLGLTESACQSAAVAQTTLITVHRSRLLEDGYSQLGQLPSQLLKGIIRVRFINEQGLDEAGIDQDGVFKEFLEEIIRTVFNPSLNLFLTTTDQRVYPSRLSHLHDNHLELFEFVGRIVGKAVYEGIVIEVPFAPFFLRQIQGTQPFLYSPLDELPTLDSELSKNLMALRSDNCDARNLELTFAVDQDMFGKVVTNELIPGGRATFVTNENKISYIHLMANFHMNLQIKDQIRAFVKGFKSIINQDWLALFSVPELQRLISGDSVSLDVKDLRHHTQYYGGFHDNHRVICWLWDIVEKDFSNHEKRLFLKFVTSCSKPPLLGFTHLEPPFSIRCVEVGEDDDVGDTLGSVIRGFFTIRRRRELVARLPTASTCFNLLKLPNYQRKSTLRDKLRYAITSNTGFELS